MNGKGACSTISRLAEGRRGTRHLPKGHRQVRGIIVCRPLMTLGAAPAVSTHVVAVVVTFNRRQTVEACLDAIDAQLRPVDNIVVVDNCSTDGTVETLRRRSPTIDVVESPDNEGFGAALARGMTYAERWNPDVYWLLDDDTFVPPSALGDALGFLDGLDDAGIVANRGGVRRWGVVRHTLHYPNASGPVRADFALVDGALVTRAAVGRVGVPRTDLFMMCEDLEYTERIRRAGLGVYVRPNDGSVSSHLGSTQ